MAVEVLRLSFVGYAATIAFSIYFLYERVWYSAPHKAVVVNFPLSVVGVDCIDYWDIFITSNRESTSACVLSGGGI